MTGTAVQEIVALEDSLTQATRALDVDALDRIYADDIIMTSVLSEPCGKTVVLDEARRGVAQRESAAAAGKPITSSYDKEDLKVSAGGGALALRDAAPGLVQHDRLAAWFAEHRRHDDVIRVDPVERVDVERARRLREAVFERDDFLHGGSSHRAALEAVGHPTGS